MIDIREINVNFDFRSDSEGKDPDYASPTLREYHQTLWSKPLPNGEFFHLTTDNCSYLRYKDMYFGSDSITASFRYKRNKELLRRIEKNSGNLPSFFNDYEKEVCTIGGEIILPKHQGSINQERGINWKICDRWDLTLECIRRYYEGESSPLDAALHRDKTFFELFVDFKGYVDFFFLQDFVTENYRVTPILETQLFENNPIPKTDNEYWHWIYFQLGLVKKRAVRIAYWCNPQRFETNV